MEEKNRNFRLNDDAKRKIEEEYYSPQPQPAGRSFRRKKRAAAAPGPIPPQPVVQPAYAPFPQYEEEQQELPKKPKKRRLRKLLTFVAVFCVIVILLNIAFLYYRGQIWFNEPRKRDYPVRGAVITQDLGKIDWRIMSQQTISFAYIRATKGTTYADTEFKRNLKNSSKQDLLVGCWHEFDFRTDGEKQAENFISQCGDMDGMLRPMVKVTKYGIYNLKMKNADKVRENLRAFLDRVEEEYGRRPVIMCDSACYKKYIKPYFDSYTLWTIDHFSEPDEDSDWALWEYNPRVRTSGYENSKEYFAMTVYRESKDIENFKKNLLM